MRSDVAGYLVDRTGRKAGMMLATAIVFVFTALAAGAYGAGGSVSGMFQALSAYRFLTGIGIGELRTRSAQTDALQALSTPRDRSRAPRTPRTPASRRTRSSGPSRHTRIALTTQVVRSRDEQRD